MPKKGKKGGNKNARNKPVSNRKSVSGKSKKRVKLSVPTNNRQKLVDLKLMRPQSYISETKATSTDIKRNLYVGGRQYEIEPKTHSLSTIF